MTPATRVRSARSRFGNLVPAAVSWAFVAATLIGLVAFPSPWLHLAAAIFAYFAGWIAVHFAFYLVGRKRCRQWQLRDWGARRDEAGSDGFAPADVWHVVLLPNYTEPLPVLRRTLDSLAAQEGARERMIVALAMEEREADSRGKGDLLAHEYAGRFARVLVSMHPANISGEIACKGANMRWAAQAAHDELGRMGVASQVTTLTACDADSVLDPRYFAAIAELFARDDRRYSRFWQAPLFYYNNMWKVPAPVRFTERLTQMYFLGELAMPGYHPLPISTYTMSLTLAEQCDWWDPAVIAEDWHVFLDYMVQRSGDVSMVPVYLPVCLDSAEGPTWLAMVKNRYIQLRRHSWGAEDVGFLAGQLLSGEPSGSVWYRFGQVLHDHVITVAAFCTAASLTLVPVLYRASAPEPGAAPVLTLPLAVTALFTVSGAAVLASMTIDLLSHPPDDRRFGWIGLEMAKMWLLLPISGLVFGALPALDAQTKLAFGLPLDWRVTPKAVRLEIGSTLDRKPTAAPDAEM